MAMMQGKALSSSNKEISIFFWEKNIFFSIMLFSEALASVEKRFKQFNNFDIQKYSKSWQVFYGLVMRHSHTFPGMAPNFMWQS